jgi:hypothetical protein
MVIILAQENSKELLRLKGEAMKDNDATMLTQPGDQKPPAPLKLRVLVWMVTAVAMFMAMAYMVRLESKRHGLQAQSSTPNSLQQASESTKPSRSGPSGVKPVGDEGKLYVEGLSTITVAVDEGSFSELTRVLLARDEYAYKELQLRGKIFRVENDTRVLILENGFTKVRVRFLEGKQKGADGWIPREWLK